MTSSNQIPNDAILHSAGMIVRHGNPFENLESLVTGEWLDKEFLKKWVIPFYFSAWNIQPDDELKLNKVAPEITNEIIRLCLGDKNWRTLQTGALFSAISNCTEFIDVIGVHLLKSEVCYAGKVYCWALAYFNTSASIRYLNDYLKYYLTRKDLFFDQFDAIAAIQYLDKINGTNEYSRHSENWEAFRNGQAEVDFANEILFLEKQIAAIHRISTFRSKQSDA